MLSSKNLMKNKKKKGFSLLEIVVSLGLIALFIIPMGNMVLGSVKINKASENKQQASAVIQETVEQLKVHEQLPQNNGEQIELNDEVIITRDSSKDKIVIDEVGNPVLDDKGNNLKDIYYKVSMKKDTEKAYGFGVDGYFYKRDIVVSVSESIIPGKPAEETIDLSQNVDGFLYWKNLNNNNNNVWVVNGQTTLQNAISSQYSGTGHFTAEDTITIEVSNNGNFQFNDKGGSLHINSKLDSLLVILDNHIWPYDLNIKVDWKKGQHVRPITIYMYDKQNKLKPEHITQKIDNVTIKVITTSSGSGGSDGDNSTTGNVNVTSSEISKYLLDINAVKAGNVIENIKADFVK